MDAQIKNQVLRKARAALKWGRQRGLSGYLVAFWAALGLFAVSPLGDIVETHLARRLEYSARHLVGQDPTLNPRIKAFSFDDSTVAATGGSGLSYSDWAGVIEAVARQRPKAILFDKLFDLPDAEVDRAAFVRRVAAAGVPVIAGAFVTSTAISQRPTVPESKLRRGPPTSLPTVKAFVYGPAADVVAGFRSVGHISYQGDGMVSPVLRLADDLYLPHIGMFAGDFAFDSTGPVLGGRPLTTNAIGQTPLNIGAKSTYASRVVSMKHLLQSIRQQTPLSSISEGDVVVILPGMYTGSADWTNTPHGFMPGGYVVLAMVNSALSNAWIQELGGGRILLLLACLMGTFVASQLWGVSLWSLLIGLPMLWASGSIAAFAWSWTLSSWLYPCFGMLGSGLLVFAARSANAKAEQIRLGHEVETARLVQERFFQIETVENEVLRISGRHKSATECSGDWWGYRSPAPGLHLVLIGDALGHGVSAALVTATIHTTFLLLGDVLKGMDVPPTGLPSFILTRFNELLWAATKGETSMTMLACLLDTSAGTVTIATAGHACPYLFPSSLDDDRIKDPKEWTAKGRARGDRASLVLRASGGPLGFDAEISFKARSYEVRAGDRIVFYTDGLIEIANRKREPFGKWRLVSYLSQHFEEPGSTLSQGMLSECLAFGAVQDDDVTVVVLDLIAPRAATIS